MGSKEQKVLHIVSISFSLKYFIGDQFKYFKEKGYDFTVACTPSDDLFQYSKEMDFKVFPVNVLRSINPLEDIKSIYKLYKFIKEENFDIVIAHSPKGGLIGMLAAFFAKAPKRIFFRHGLVFQTSKGFKKSLLINIEKMTGKCSHKVVNVSQSILQESEMLHLNSPTKNVILGNGTCNGVDIKKFEYKPKTEYEGKLVIGFIGRLCDDKGINELVESLDYLEEDEILLLLVGPLDDRAGLSEKVMNKIINHPKIKYVGEVNNTSYYYNQMDVFVLPSYREGFPTVNLEASASSLPIITTKKTGCVDSIIENKTGIFTDIDACKIAESIKYYQANEDVRKQHGINGRKFVEDNFAEEIIYKEIESKLLSCQF